MKLEKGINVILNVTDIKNNKSNIDLDETEEEIDDFSKYMNKPVEENKE